ncbi:neutral amino acid transporter [Lunasporangiospora selenospora]|uniref:Neutral amino acid transporter n=1 Tax=Lunasporangiospora selenospora TaxID=979761 RepID=A0A9P6FZX2_9FUNG|nr:neutral amino acid transporter [Lunasporangiospora selenospora]
MGGESETVPSSVARSVSTKRLQASAIDTIQTAQELDTQQLHEIVGQHLVFQPLVADAGATSPSTSPNLTSDGFSHTTVGASLEEPSTKLDRRPSSVSSSSSTHAPSSSARSTSEGSDSAALNSHFKLQGGAEVNDVYKWHEKQTRQKLGPRSNTYHAPKSEEDPMIEAIKTPGGFRRHYIQQDAVTRGEPAPEIHSKSFLHFLAKFNMYEFDHFAGENFKSVPRRSIVVPRDADKRRISMADTLGSRRYFVPGEELKEDEIAIEEPEEKLSFSKAVGMLFKTFIASGILFLPNAFKNGGILFAPLFMTLVAVLCLHSFLLLVKCRELHPGSYGDIGQYFYGRWMRYLVLFSIAISQFGFCCGYCIFFAQQFALVVDSLGGAHLDKTVWIIIFFIILVPFTLVRNIGRLGFSTFVADLCIIVGLLYLYAYDIKALVNNQGSPNPLRLFNTEDFGIFVGTAVFSYEGIGMVIPICGSMANPKQFPRALTIVLTVVCVLLVSFGSLGYAAYGDNVQTIVLDDLPSGTKGEKAGKNAIQLLYIIAVFLTTPLMLFPCIRIIEHAVLKAAGAGPKSASRLMKENLVRVLIDVGVAVVAYAGYTKLDIFIAFVGSFACAPLLFIFPPLFHLKAFPGQPLWRKVSDVTLILFGLLVFSYTLVITIQSFSKH